MAFNNVSGLSAAQLETIASAALDYYVKGDAFNQTIQDKPLLSALRGKQKTFAGGKEKISVPVVGEYLNADSNFFKGFNGTDSVTFQNPSYLKRAAYGYFEIHAGITVSFSELKADGITINDSAFGEKTSQVAGRELTALTSLLDHKLQSMSEGWSREMNEMLWRDGTQDAKVPAGILAYITDTVATGTVGGINRATSTWWRSRPLVTTTAGSDALTTALRKEVRQLSRYGGKPNLILCGSKFLDALEAEVAAKSQYSNTGVAGTRNIASPSVTINGIGTFVYDPTLDDLQTIVGGAIDYSKRCYFIDTDALCLYVMEGEDNKIHAPARPEDKYALYRSMTWTGGTVAKRLNSCGVHAIA